MNYKGKNLIVISGLVFLSISMLAKVRNDYLDVCWNNMEIDPIKAEKYADTVISLALFSKSKLELASGYNAKAYALYKQKVFSKQVLDFIQRHSIYGVNIQIH